MELSAADARLGVFHIPALHHYARLFSRRMRCCLRQNPPGDAGPENPYVLRYVSLALVLWCPLSIILQDVLGRAGSDLLRVGMWHTARSRPGQPTNWGCTSVAFSSWFSPSLFHFSLRSTTLFTYVAWIYRLQGRPFHWYESIRGYRRPIFIAMYLEDITLANRTDFQKN